MKFDIVLSHSHLHTLANALDRVMDWFQFKKKRKREGRKKENPTWYLLVELKGISVTFLFRDLTSITSPKMTSENFSRAVSEASPPTILCMEEIK